METNHVVWCDPDDFYFLHRIIWVVCSFSRKKNQRNWNQKSVRRISQQHHYDLINGFSKTRDFVNVNRNTGCVACCRKVAGALSLQDFIKLVDVFSCSNRGGNDCLGNCQFPGNKSGGGKSGEEFENRMMR